LDRKVDGEFSAQYLGNGIWSVKKTCPIFSQYNVYWYFYEDVGQLEQIQLFSGATEGAIGVTQQAAVISNQSRGQKLNDLYAKIDGHLEQVYMLNQQLEDFDWRSIKYLKWKSSDENGNEHVTQMADILPSKETFQPLVVQNDRCSAFNTLLWLENPYQKPVDGRRKHLTPAEWYVLNKRLKPEIDKAQDLVNNIHLNISQKFADIDKEINVPGAMAEAYVGRVQMRHAEYLALLDETMQCLEEAKLLAVKINNLAINLFVLDAP